MDDVKEDPEYVRTMQRQLHEFDRQNLLWHTKVRVLRLARMVTTGAVAGLLYHTKLGQLFDSKVRLAKFYALRDEYEAKCTTYYREAQALKSFQQHLLAFNKQEQSFHESTFVKRLDLYHKAVVKEYLDRGEKSWLSTITQFLNKFKRKEETIPVMEKLAPVSVSLASVDQARKNPPSINTRPFDPLVEVLPGEKVTKPVRYPDVLGSKNTSIGERYFTEEELADYYSIRANLLGPALTILTEDVPDAKQFQVGSRVVNPVFQQGPNLRVPDDAIVLHEPTPRETVHPLEDRFEATIEHEWWQNDADEEEEEKEYFDFEHDEEEDDDEDEEDWDEDVDELEPDEFDYSDNDLWEETAPLFPGLKLPTLGFRLADLPWFERDKKETEGEDEDEDEDDEDDDEEEEEEQDIDEQDERESDEDYNDGDGGPYDDDDGPETEDL